MSSQVHSPAQETARQLLDKLTRQADKYAYSFKDVEKVAATEEILKADPDIQIAFIRECVNRVTALRNQLGQPENQEYHYMNLSHERNYPQAGSQVVLRLLRRKLPFEDSDIVFLVSRTADLEMTSTHAVWHLEPLIGIAERHVSTNGLSEPLANALHRLHATLDWISNAPERRLQQRIGTLLDEPREVPIEPGEAWSDAAIHDLDQMPAKQKAAWVGLLNHCEAATGSKPSQIWLKAAQTASKAIDKQQFQQCVLAWFPLVDKPRTQVIERFHQGVPDPNRMIIEPHAQILKGLAWCCALEENQDIARALAVLAVSAYKKVPQIGPRAVKVGNACVYALGAMPGTAAIGSLALLKVKVKFGSAQKELDKALEAAAKRAGMPAEDLQEMGVPAYGLTKVGRLAEPIGDFTALLAITGTHSTELTWLGPGGKPQKSVPAAVKKDHAEDLKELNAAAKDIQKMLPAQRDRIDSLFLKRKSWPYAIWRERYLDHPLVGTLARRIIWQFHTGKKSCAGIFFDGELVNQQDRPLDNFNDDTQVELWHPIGCEIDDVLAWRRWLEDHRVQQPFKQAHREVYVLTDAERTTGVYSNRFAAHVLRQHQFNALCGQRGWKNKLRLLVDAEYPPAALLLPQWNLRAEFWIEGAGTEFGVDTNDTGTYYHLTTDQVRFYSLNTAQRTAHAYGRGYAPQYGQNDEAPLQLEDIPPLVFSEVMRDVDLFVGVASVGNDPNWSDGGPQGQYRDYWQSYSFGDLSATAQTRKETLQRLVPRLKIAEQCEFVDRFLVVRGELHTYKIHLGSGNILMSPNDQYLCIVAKQSAATKEDGKIFLPFEGDNMLSIVLSKALLLAEDAKIKDASIRQQILKK